MCEVSAADARDQDFRCGAGECAGRMMLGDPVALEAEPISESRKLNGVAKRVGGSEAGRNGALVDDRKFHGDAYRSSCVGASNDSSVGVTE